ncbi:hypothetical protein [Methylobacterium sp. JK268]
MAAAQHGNGPNPERTRECVERIEAIADRKEAAHMEYMRQCSVFAEETKAVYDEAKKAWGLNRRSLKAVIKTRAMERKLEALRDDLEGEEQETFDQIRHALGDLADTPLGQTVLPADDGAEEDVRSPAQKRREKARQDRDAALDAVSADNAARITAGISKLN